MEWCWADTYCIDKSSSADLSEAINSMYAWYRAAEVCHVYLSDYNGPPATDDQRIESSWFYYRQFAGCRWWERGWTLQELLAPSKVKFWNHDWSFIGRLNQLVKTVSSITGIDELALLGAQPMQEIPVAKRISWASKRQTTRVEDEAYSLLGIFDVNMPLIYGEGRRAYRRLCEEILKRSTDLSIFAWDYPKGLRERYRSALLPDRSRSFADWRNAERTDWSSPESVPVPLTLGERIQSPFEITNAGLRITLPYAPLSAFPEVATSQAVPVAGADARDRLIGVDLGCHVEDDEDLRPLMILKPYKNTEF
jgi:hypothetical protein